MEEVGIIFDFDGTLVDSTWIWCEVMTSLIRDRGTCQDDAWIHSTAHITQFSKIMSHVKERYGLQGSIDTLIEEADERMKAYYYRDVVPRQCVVKLLDQLSARSVRMCVATASEREMVQMVSEKCGIAKYFEAIISCQDYAVNKKQPDIYHIARGILGTSVEQTVVFEDMVFAVKTAKEAGFPVVAVYDEVSATHSDEIRSLADRYITSFQELMDDPRWLEQLVQEK